MYLFIQLFLCIDKFRTEVPFTKNKCFILSGTSNKIDGHIADMCTPTDDNGKQKA